SGARLRAGPDRKDRPARRRAPAPARSAGDQGCLSVHAGTSGRDRLRLARRRRDRRRHAQALGHVELPDARRATGTARPGRVLAGAPIAPGEHQQDQGDRPLVQSELHPADERREVDGNSGQPNADAQAQGVPEAVSERSPERLALPGEPERPAEGLALPGEPERPAERLALPAEPERPAEQLALPGESGRPAEGLARPREAERSAEAHAALAEAERSPDQRAP